MQERDHMTGEVERLKSEEAQAALEKKRAAEALMEEVHRSNAEQVRLLVHCQCGMLHDICYTCDIYCICDIIISMYVYISNFCNGTML